ncbi:TetR/AcrR family transcriptional regulator [Variovorax sp. PDC80]|jgi:AcrR family transcriptional regulator|uniref:TetR/AcrR family transcriptional regulator n=1 Tax=unclassified Variovorax TaxID=663243 RepID=UPI0008EF0DF6|nr:TetR/AcrR family transcriptional regulator [Variovorax sp. PDC80]SFP94503.1 transcriptional regulator, TetR family [Variovorax sp. PDC80]
MARKAPRRTAQRILEAALDLFNRFGEPNVSTTLVAGELNISPGNLYYHYPAKEELINKLYEGYETELGELLHASEGIHDVEDAWFFMHSLFELIWRHRFLYRDLNDLLSKNRHLETQFQLVLKHKVRAMRQLIAGLGRAGHLEIDAQEVDTLAQSMVVVLTYWLSYEYVRNPRQALEPAHAQAALLRGARHTLHQLAPYLGAEQRRHLLTLGQAYGGEDAASSPSASSPADMAA